MHTWNMTGHSSNYYERGQVFLLSIKGHIPCRGVAQLGNACVWVEIKVLRIKYELVCVYGILFDDIPFVQNKDLLKCNVNLNGGTINLMYY